LGALGGRADAVVEGEAVEAGVGSEEGLCGGLDGGQVGEVDGEGFDRAGGGGEELLEFGDGGGGFLRGAPGDVERCVVLVEDLGELVADAAVAAGDDVDLLG
jgi:hypothetical protein